jgi:hypothetical protein
VSTESRLRDELAERRKEIRTRRRRIAKLAQGSLKSKLIRRQRKVIARVGKIRKFLADRVLHKTVAFDGTPMFRGQALALQDARDHGWSGSATSADRRKGVAERFGKLSQFALWVGFWVKHLPGFNPANRPGQSPHELRSDGVAYRGPVGRPLAWWQLGIDTTEADELRAILNRFGYQVFRPYSDPREVQHTQFRVNPRRTLRRRGLA